MLELYKKLLHNKFFLVAAIISGFVLLLSVLISPKKERSLAPIPSSPPTAISQLRSELSNLNEEKRQAAIDYYDLVSDNFPFHLPKLATSVGINTEVYIYHAEDDPLEITRFEVIGLSYVNKNELDPSKNPNVTAFKESFQMGLSVLREAGIDPSKLIFVYGDKDYVQATASYWVDKLGLLR